MEDYIEVKATVRIPAERIQDLIVAAVEGGTNYWAKYKFPVDYKEKYGAYEKIPLQGGEIKVYDVESGELLGYLDRGAIQVGLQLMANCKDVKGKKVPARHYENFATDNEDAETADVFMQLSVLGEIVFG